MGKNPQKRKHIPFWQALKNRCATWANVDFVKSVLLTPDYLLAVAFALLVFESAVGVFIVENIPYTEIDWKAYMQEVEGFLNGTMDYSKLKGDTGPLVYPAGFVYIYSLLYYLTNRGENIKCAQYIFIVLYLVMLSLVFRIYIRTKKVPAYVLGMMCFTTYRIHSIFMLRLFNDPLAMIFLYAALNLFLDNRWNLGSIFFSLAVSVKMNVLLFSPSLLLAYLTCLGFVKTIVQLSICALVQLILGLPFLVENPTSYIKGSFDLGRVFLHKWTVNWRFLPEATFVNGYFHIGLLCAHLFTLAIFLNATYTYLKSYARCKYLEECLQPKFIKPGSYDASWNPACAQLFVLPMFIANFIGITFSRSLHYQFYVWYYHTIPYLLWCTKLSIPMKLTLLGLIELSWNTYPSTIFSSTILNVSHIIVLHSLYQAMYSTTSRDKIKS